MKVTLMVLKETNDPSSQTTQLRRRLETFLLWKRVRNKKKKKKHISLKENYEWDRFYSIRLCER